MPSTKDLLSDTRVKLTIDVPFGQLQPAIDKAYQEIAKQVNIPGFRKGKIPHTLIDQRYGREAVLQEAVNEILPAVYGEALAEHGLTPLGEPKVDLTNMEDGTAAQFTIEVDIVPEFTLPDFSKVKVNVEPTKVSDAEVDERVNLLQQRFATYSDLDRAAKEGDIVIIDLSAAKNGKALPDSDAHGMSYRVGAGGLVDGLDEAVTGLKTGGTKTFTSTLVGGAHEGEDADVTVTVQKVQEQVLPPVDDDFAQLVSEYDTAAEMLEGLRESLVRMARIEQANVVRDKVLDEVVAKTKFALPPSVVDEEFEPRKQQLEQQLAQLGMTVESYLARSEEESTKDPDEFWATIKERTERGIRAQIILDRVATEREVGVTQEDLTSMLMQKAAENDSTPDEEAKHMMEHGHMQEWLGDIRRGKAVGLLVNEATVTAGGEVLDMARLRADGSYEDAAPSDAEANTETKPKKAAPKAKKETATDKPKKAAK